MRHRASISCSPDFGRSANYDVSHNWLPQLHHCSYWRLPIGCPKAFRRAYVCPSVFLYNEMPLQLLSILHSPAKQTKQLASLFGAQNIIDF